MVIRWCRTHAFLISLVFSLIIGVLQLIIPTVIINDTQTILITIAIGFFIHCYQKFNEEIEEIRQKSITSLEPYGQELNEWIEEKKSIHDILKKINSSEKFSQPIMELCHQIGKIKNNQFVAEIAADEIRRLTGRVEVSNRNKKATVIAFPGALIENFDKIFTRYLNYLVDGGQWTTISNLETWSHTNIRVNKFLETNISSSASMKIRRLLLLDSEPENLKNEDKNILKQYIEGTKDSAITTDFFVCKNRKNYLDLIYELGNFAILNPTYLSGRIAINIRYNTDIKPSQKLKIKTIELVFDAHTIGSLAGRYRRFVGKNNRRNYASQFLTCEKLLEILGKNRPS